MLGRVFDLGRYAMHPVINYYGLQVRRRSGRSAVLPKWRYRDMSEKKSAINYKVKTIKSKKNKDVKIINMDLGVSP